MFIISFVCCFNCRHRVRRSLLIISGSGQPIIRCGPLCCFALSFVRFVKKLCAQTNTPCVAVDAFVRQFSRELIVMFIGRCPTDRIWCHVSTARGETSRVRLCLLDSVFVMSENVAEWRRHCSRWLDSCRVIGELRRRRAIRRCERRVWRRLCRRRAVRRATARARASGQRSRLHSTVRLVELATNSHATLARMARVASARFQCYVF